MPVLIGTAMTAAAIGFGAATAHATFDYANQPAGEVVLANTAENLAVFERMLPAFNVISHADWIKYSSKHTTNTLYISLESCGPTTNVVDLHGTNMTLKATLNAVCSAAGVYYNLDGPCIKITTRK